MKYFAVIGNPILHSKSPEIYNSWFKSDNIEAHYSRIAAENIHDALYLYDEIKLSGINITSPFKNKAFASCDDIISPADYIESVNTIIDFESKKIGFNTDYLGVINALNANNISIENKAICVIGAGNAGKATLYAFKDKNLDLYLTNRNNKKCKLIAEKYNSKFIPLQDINNHISKFDIIINCLDPKYLNINYCNIKSNAVILDAIYNNLNLKTNAIKYGIKYIPGTDWLIHQAAPAYKSFTGNEVNSGIKLDNKIFNNKEINNIYLIGFMAAGKSTIGKMLADNLKMNFYDLDDEIEKYTKKSINQIFLENGEIEFRKIEKSRLKKISKKENSIISLGGGSVLSIENKKIISKNSLVIYLFTSFSIALQRMNLSNNRPIFNNSDISKLNDLYNQRKSIYYSMSDLIINSENKLEKVIERLSDEISNIKSKNIFQVIAPSSKSYFQREVAISLLSNNAHNIIFNSLCDDSLSTIRLAYEIGKVEFSSNLITFFYECDLNQYSNINQNFITSIRQNKLEIKLINSKEKYFFILVSATKSNFPSVINCGESGLAFNLFTAIAALQNKEVTINAEGTLLNRSREVLIKCLEATGKNVIRSIKSDGSQSNYPPIKVNGTINNYNLAFNTIESSQAISALLLVYSQLNIESVIKFKEIKSYNYALMSIKSLINRGKNIVIKGNSFIINKSENTNSIPDESHIEGCWSSASFWFILSACTEYNITISNLSNDSLQADKAILDIIELSGAEIEYNNGQYSISKPAFKAFNYDCNNCPDLIPNLIIFAAFLPGTTTVLGANRLINKESNRLNVILNEFTKFNIDVKQKGDALIVNKSNPKAQKINYFSDHRIEMAANLLYLILGDFSLCEKVTKYVTKSYKTFDLDINNFKSFNNNNYNFSSTINK